ncbi:MAG: tRNA pseudouridine(38-40) synthase TruA, partial [bacterium]|nr:tRNA pseudouridine(38-40) synthase TruA [bacterium]
MQTRNIKLTIEYDGSRYCGWQIQPKRTSIQKVLETTLKIIVNEPIKLVAAGRTDAGVHALGQVANFKTTSSIPLINLVAALNSLLPQDIVVKNAEEVPDSFNARRDAKYRIYQYRILNRKLPSAFHNQFSYFYPYPLNLTRMRNAAKYFIGSHDFTAVNASPNLVKNSIRTVAKLSIRRKNDCVLISIQANGFLHNMVRIIVGTLIDVSRGKLEPEEVPEILNSKQRKKAGMTVPPQGLFL